MKIFGKNRLGVILCAVILFGLGLMLLPAIASAAEVQFSIPEGHYDEPQTIVLTCDPGWKICYTTDGSSPIINKSGLFVFGNTMGQDMIFLEPNFIGDDNPVIISVDHSARINAVAYRDRTIGILRFGRYNFSSIKSQTYIIGSEIIIGDNFLFSLAGGTYAEEKELTVTSLNGWNICYTTDGSDPVQGPGPYSPGTGASTARYQTPVGNGFSSPVTIPITKSCIFKVVAYQKNMAEYTFSEIAEQTYHIIPAGSTQDGDIHFQPAGGVFEYAVEVTLTAPAEWEICYTTDGSNPVSSQNEPTGKRYTKPIIIPKNTVLKAVAWHLSTTSQTGYEFGEIAEQTYKIIPAGSAQVGDINFMPAGGLIENPVKVTLTVPNDYSICYTTDGSDPVNHYTNTPAGTQYTGPITISEDTVLKAVTYQQTGSEGNEQYTFSPVAGQAYLFFVPDYTLTLAAPEFTPVYRGYAQPEAQPLTIVSTGNSDATITSVSLSGPAADSFILNKTDGAVIPAEETDDTTYTIQPKAGLDRGFYSAKVTVAYDGGATADAYITFTVDGMDAVAAPVISPATGDYYSVQWVTLTSATEGASIYYTTDGTDPNPGVNGDPYTDPIPVSVDTTIKAIAIKGGMERSVITEAAYTVRLRLFYGENDLILNQERQQVICPFTPEKDGFYRFFCGDEEISTDIRVCDENGDPVGAHPGEMRNNNWIAELEGGREYTVKVQSLYGTGAVTVLIHSTMMYNIYADPDTAHGQIGISSGALPASGGNVIGRAYAGAEVFFTGEPDEGYGLRSLEIVNAIGGVLPQDPVFTMPFGTVTVRARFDTLQTLSFEGDEHARFTNIWQDGGGMPVWEDVYDREVICGQIIQMNWECNEDWTADTFTVTTASGAPVDWTFGWDADDQKVIQFEMPGENVHVTMTSTTFSFDSADFILPADTQSIEANAFQGDTHITAVVIPANCGSIGVGAFKDCTNLSYIRIPQGCEIGTNAFDGCEWVRIYGTEGSPAWQYCETHDNCIFVEE